MRLLRLRAASVGLFLAAFAAAMGAEPPRPAGTVVDIGGRQMHLLCEGHGSPAVILESGAGGFSVDWALALPLIAQETRVCAYDRAGYAWSGMSAGFEQFPAAAQDLRAALQAAGVRPPWILVGHAMGALYARDYQRRHPEYIAGMALVDPTPEEDFQVAMMGNTVSLIDLADHDLRAWPVRPFVPSLTSPPPSRPGAGGRIGAPFDKLPRAMAEAHQWALQRLLEELDRLSAEQAAAVMESERATFIDLYNARHNPATSPLKLPIVELSRGRNTTPSITQMQDALSQLSRDEIHRTVPNSGAEIQIEAPAAVASAVQAILHAVRSGHALSSATSAR